MKHLLFVMLLAIFSATVQAEEKKEFPNNYAVVWKLEQSEEKKKLIAENLSKQANAVLELWKSGKIENVYMTPEKADENTSGAASGFVFFIKADSEPEVDEMLAELPFVKLKLGSYELYKVGLLWLKQPENKEEKEEKSE